ncbi:peptidase M13 [Georgenia sp. 10Sc9-8]|uniref:Peptidase M13 n=1 Tax=Georgenia halotolerans TaxID=3028317 RepID=A0ABT5TYL7_9MICO|nr:peptidase M13 [Georgenia halotolerans]
MTDTSTRTMSLTPLADVEAAMDRDVRPQDDLFRHANGTWLREHAIPADRARDGAFHALRDLSEERVREIILAAAERAADSPEAQKIGDLFSSFMATERIETLGTNPLRQDLDLLTAALDKEALTRALGRLQPTGIRGGVALMVENDFNDPDRYRLFLWQSGLGLPDESYYREDTHEHTRTAYVAHIAAMLALSGLVTEDEAMGAAERVMRVETALAGHHWDKVRTREADQLNNPVSWQELLDSAPGFDWDLWRESMGVPADAVAEVIAAMPSYLTGFAATWAQLDVDSLRMWLTWQVVSGRAAYLPEAFVEENFDFYGRTLTGAEELRDRWKRGVGLVEGAMGEAVGKLYVAEHFPPENKAAMQQLVDNLIAAYRQSIDELDWMGPDTRRRALEKLEAFTPKIGYPDRWRDYSALEITAEDLMGNVRAASEFEFRRELGKLGKPIDRDEWLMSPQTVNAYYNPMMNEIVFPAAILQPPFFEMGADDAWNYGGIGAVIGHEIGHGFDDQGSKYSGSGKLEDWWTADDRAEFEKRTTVLIGQYDELSPTQLDDTHRVNGSLTIGENIGDLGGLSIAIKAYDIALRSQGLAGLTEAPTIDGLTGLQRVFYSWARVWREKARDAEAIRLLNIDPHSPAEFRCNGVVRNMDTFAEAFDVRPGDALYLPPEERVRIW